MITPTEDNSTLVESDLLDLHVLLINDYSC